MSLALLERDVSLAAPTATSSDAPQILRLVQDDNRVPAAEDLRGEALQVRSLVNRHPRSPAAHARLARTEFDTGNRDGAIAASCQAIELLQSQWDPTAAVVVAQVLALCGRSEDAEKLLAAHGDDAVTPMAASFAAQRGAYSLALERLRDRGDPPSLALR